MVQQFYMLGSVGPLYYDDSQEIVDPNTGQGTGYFQNTVNTTGQLFVQKIPTADPNVLRKDDIDGPGLLFADYTFNMTTGGFSPNFTVGAKIHRAGRICTLWIPRIRGTSNSTTLNFGPLPTDCWPTRNVIFAAWGYDNGTPAGVTINLFANTGNILVYNGLGYPFTPSGDKAIWETMITYALV